MHRHEARLNEVSKVLNLLAITINTALGRLERRIYSISQSIDPQTFDDLTLIMISILFIVLLDAFCCMSFTHFARFSELYTIYA